MAKVNRNFDFKDIKCRFCHLVDETFDHVLACSKIDSNTRQEQINTGTEWVRPEDFFKCGSSDERKRRTTRAKIVKWSLLNKLKSMPMPKTDSFDADDDDVDVVSSLMGSVNCCAENESGLSH